MSDNFVRTETQKWIDRLFTAEDEQYDRTCDLLAADCRAVQHHAVRKHPVRLKQAHFTLSSGDVTLREVIKIANSIGGRLVIRIRPAENTNPTLDLKRKPKWME